MCDFEDLEFCSMLSDVHCAVKVNIQCIASEPKESSGTPVAKIKKWQNAMRDSFINNISVDVNEDLHVLLDNTQSSDDV